MSTLKIQTPQGPLCLDDAPHRELAGETDDSSPLPRVAYAATHVAMAATYSDVPHQPEAPGDAARIAEHIDWDTTLRLRERIASNGLGIAEAMDTAQRFSLGWDAAEELIRRSSQLDLAAGFCAGATSDQDPGETSLRKIVDLISEQVDFIHNHGGVAVLLPIPALVKEDNGPETYVETYRELINQAPPESTLLIHWLGEMFLPGMERYFPGDSFLEILRIDPSRVRGAKISLLDHELEVRLRREMLAHDQLMFTGDDFNFGSLIAGDNTTTKHTSFAGREVAIGDFSHALLGVFDAIAAPAALAMRRLAMGDRAGYDRIMAPCETLGQVIFEEPTRHYKTGLAFLAWLNGLQPNPMLVNHEETSRDQAHLIRVARAASDAGAILDARIAAERLQAWLAQS